MAPSRRPVLVTGSNRSGTTWVGRMLCLSHELAYVHEPFNPGIWPRWTKRPIPYRNFYLSEENSRDWKSEIQGVIDRRFPIGTQAREIRSLRDSARLIRETKRNWRPRSKQRAQHTPTLMKDPIAIFSTEWLASEFDMQVVMMIREPLAFAGSIKRLKWAFDFNNWTDQPLLMRYHLGEYTDEIHRATNESLDLIDQAILSWNATYAYVANMQQRHIDWHFVDYRHLAHDPVDEFAALYKALGLTFDRGISAAISSYSDETNVKEVTQNDKGDIRRDSRAAIDTWKHRLTPEETERVKRGTKDVVSRLLGSGYRP